MGCAADRLFQAGNPVIAARGQGPGGSDLRTLSARNAVQFAPLLNVQQHGRGYQKYVLVTISFFLKSSKNTNHHHFQPSSYSHSCSLSVS